MKRSLFRLLAVGAVALGLAGCAGTPVDISALTDAAEALTAENTSTAKGATAGMSSSDAANVLNTREYYKTVRAVHGAPTEKAPPLLEIESHDGKPIQIDAKVFRVNAPRVTGGGAVAIAEPREIEPMGFKISREARAWVLGWFGWDLEKDRETTRRLVVTTDATTQRFETGTNANLMRDLVGTKNDPAALDRAEADKTRAEADRIRATATTP